MLDRLSDDQLRDIKGALKILVNPQFAGIPEVQIVSVSLQDLLAKVDVYLSQPSLQADMEVEDDKKKSQCTFHFLDAQKVREAGDAFDRMPEFSNLQTDGWLVQLPIDIRKAHWGFYRNDVLTVSHSWESKPHPDTMGVQWQSILKYVRSDVGFPCDVVALLCQAAHRNDSRTVRVTCRSSSCDSMMLPLERKQHCRQIHGSTERACCGGHAHSLCWFFVRRVQPRSTRREPPRRKASTDDAARVRDSSSESCPSCGINTLSAHARGNKKKQFVVFFCFLDWQGHPICDGIGG